MKKIFTTIVVLLVVLLIVAVAARNFIARTAVSAGVKAVTGLTLTMDGMNVDIFNTALGIVNMKIYNPEGYADKLMLDMPEIYVDYDLPALLKKDIHLTEVRIDLSEFVVVRDASGELNLDSLKVVKEEKETAAAPAEKEETKAAPQFRIDLLKLKLGKVVYKDYSKGGEADVREFKLNIDKEYKDITNPQALAMSIMTTAFVNTTLGQLTGFDIGGVTEQLGDTLKTATGLVGDTTGQAADVGKEVEKAAQELLENTSGAVSDTLKKLLPFGGK